ncbi:plasmid stabilization protein [Rhodoferax lacus]|uniref:Plasmid stabilization protein n=1 Tax=Rhodoferax lacus TaxID=2184758 RepID=A0A3E1REG0_9BURK|nr:type II toxin-antitoxin system RelE/ParE family toxin [Rhodoferax lacus]RFO97755.1 plasmid stabilization protein [Rhodoferax lacus]
MSVRLLEPAQAELDEAIDWYEVQAPGLGDAFLIETLKTIQLIEQFPTAWHPLTAQIRRCRLRRFPYSVIYTRDGSELLVLAIAHQRRKPNYWQGRLNV